MKKLIKPLLFIIIFVILFNGVSRILWGVFTPISLFYKEPKNSLDVVYLGPSNVYDHFNTVLAYNEYGFTTVMLTAGSQPFSMIKNLIKESEKYQRPKVYIIDVGMIAIDVKDIELEMGRLTMDSMKFSLNRKDVIDKFLKYKNVTKQDYINYYFSFFLYHNNWKTIKSKNFVGDSDLYKGFNLTLTTAQVISQESYKWLNKRSNLPKDMSKELTELIDYIKEQKLNVVFVIPNRYYNEKLNMLMNDVISIIEANKLKIINFNTLKNFKIDYKTDFCDSAHLNVYGATKYTLYFGKYLKEQYHLPDHRYDEFYKSWDKEFNRFKTNFSDTTKKSFDEYLKSLNSNFSL